MIFAVMVALDDPLEAQEGVETYQPALLKGLNKVRQRHHF